MYHHESTEKFNFVLNIFQWNESLYHNCIFCQYFVMDIMWCIIVYIMVYNVEPFIHKYSYSCFSSSLKSNIGVGLLLKFQIEIHGTPIL